MNEIRCACGDPDCKTVIRPNTEPASLIVEGPEKYQTTMAVMTKQTILDLIKNLIEMYEQAEEEE